VDMKLEVPGCDVNQADEPAGQMKAGGEAGGR
jgi:hypothetical protein